VNDAGPLTDAMIEALSAALDGRPVRASGTGPTNPTVLIALHRRGLLHRYLAPDGAPEFTITRFGRAVALAEPVPKSLPK